jgi:hypothetical protein
MVVGPVDAGRLDAVDRVARVAIIVQPAYQNRDTGHPDSGSSGVGTFRSIGDGG